MLLNVDKQLHHPSGWLKKKMYYLSGIWRWLLKEDRRMCLGERESNEFDDPGKLKKIVK